MVCFVVKIFFVDTREVARFTFSEPIRSPYASLQHLLASRGLGAFNAVWSDDYNNLFPLKSDRGFADALNSRHYLRQPLRIFVKETYQEGSYGNTGCHTAFQNVAGRDEPSHADGPPRAWIYHKESGFRDRVASLTGRKRDERPTQQRQTGQELKRESCEASKIPASLMPKDPSLAELVDNVRHKLDMVASMHGSVTLDGGNASAKGNEEPVYSHASLVPLQFVAVSAILEQTDAKTTEITMRELLEDFTEEEAKRSCATRSESVMSDFMVITPDSDSCVHFNMEDFEAAVLELDSEDTFEIVDAPDDWDDLDWKQVEAAI